MLIGLVGKKQVGKTTVAHYLVECHNFVELAFATPLKDMVLRGGFCTEKEVYGPEKTPTSRMLMQYTGELFRREVDPDYWVKLMQQNLDGCSKYENIVISDVRYLNEAELITSRGGILIRIKRDTGLVDTHRSEMEQERIVVDFEIDNNSSILFMVGAVTNYIEWWVDVMKCEIDQTRLY